MASCFLWGLICFLRRVCFCRSCMWRNVSKTLWYKLLSMGIPSHKTKKGDGSQKLDYNPNYLKKTIGYSLFSKSVAALFHGVKYALLVFFQFLEPIAEIFHIFKMDFLSFEKNVDFCCKSSIQDTSLCMAVMASCSAGSTVLLLASFWR